MQMSVRVLIFSLLLFLGLGLQDQVLANQQPLLMEGKKTLYQRVLTRPGAIVYKKLGDENGVQQAAFTRYYVYQRKQQLNKEWIEVGTDSRGTKVGWISADVTTPWKQQLTLAFSQSAGRERVLFFKDKNDLEKILTAESPVDEIASIRKKITADSVDQRIISIEPDKPVDINKEFYLLPILQAEEVYTETGERNMLEVASVSQLEKNENTNDGNPSLLLRRFKAAVVFVIDSTISMGPYIDRTKDAVKQIYTQIDEEGLADRIKFGLVAYRSNVNAVPGLEYTTRMFVDPVEVKDGKDFLAKVADLKAASVSSSSFNEDSYAGIMDALSSIEWTEFGARYIVLITDAGAIDGDNQLSSTGFGAEQVREEAKFRGVAIYNLHLRTARGEKNHQQAEAQYKVLSSSPLLEKPLYYPVDMGSVDEFGRIVDGLAKSVVDLVNNAYQGKSVAGSARTADQNFGQSEDKDASKVDTISQDIALMGHAMQLSYLGRESGVKVPPVFNAWISDAVIEDATKKAVEVRVLLTKNQLSDMYQVVKSITDAVLEGMISPDNFFSQLRSAAATLGRDPNQKNQSQNAKLSELGLIGEYLEDLPYHSFILGLDQEAWAQLGPHQQDAILKDLNKKLKYYEYSNDDSDRWISLAEGSDPADYVYPVPIEMLP